MCYALIFSFCRVYSYGTPTFPICSISCRFLSLTCLLNRLLNSFDSGCGGAGLISSSSLLNFVSLYILGIDRTLIVDLKDNSDSGGTIGLIDITVIRMRFLNNF